MRRIIFERYQDECINLVLLKRDIEHLKSEISELEESMASVKRVCWRIYLSLQMRMPRWMIINLICYI